MHTTVASNVTLIRFINIYYYYWLHPKYMEWSVWLEKSMEKFTLIALKTHTLTSRSVLSKGVLCFQKKKSPFENISLRDEP